MHAVGLGAEAHQVDAADGALRVQGGAAAGMWGACKRAAGSARAEGRLGQSRSPVPRVCRCLAPGLLRPSSPAGPHTAPGSRVPSAAQLGVPARSPPSARFHGLRSAPGPHHDYKHLHQQALPAAPVPVLTPPVCPSTEHRVSGNAMEDVMGTRRGKASAPLGPPELHPWELGSHGGKFWGTEAAKEDEITLM